jgi:hypothetical protein
VTDSQGRWFIQGLPSGNLKISAEAPGFKTTVLNANYDANQPATYQVGMSVASTAETVEVTAQAAQVETMNSELSSLPLHGNSYTPRTPKAPPAALPNASINVTNLQKLVAGALPVAVDVPRAGTSFSFVRPLVLDEETKVTFSYKVR